MIKIGKNISEWSSYSCQPKTKDELKKIIEDRIEKEGPNCDLNDIDVSLIDDMSYLFSESEFDGDISDWNVSNVIDMTGMFYKSNFNQPIGEWNVNNVESMSYMFSESKFNQDISNWKINKACCVNRMFVECPIKDEFKPKFNNIFLKFC